MQTAPDNWAEVWTADHTVELRAVIGGAEYGMDAIIACSVHKAAFDTLAIGQAVSSALELTLLPSGTIPKAADIRLYVRLRSGDIVTDWIPQGVYYIDTREETDYGLLALTAYDRMIFADADYFADGVISGTWPKPAPEVVTDICSRLGVGLDSRSTLKPSIMVSTPIGLTMRDLLGYIATAHGGNFVISPAGELRLLPLEGITEIGGTPLDCEGVTLINNLVTISRIVLAADDKAAYFAGDENGYELKAYCPFASQELADALLDQLNGVRYVPARVETAVFYPLLELGDAFKTDGHVSRAYNMDITYDILCTADISAPIDGDVEHEIPYASGMEKLIKYTAAQTKAEIKLTTDSIISRVEAVDGKATQIQQTVDGITLEVTEQAGADGQVYARISLQIGPNKYSGLIKMEGNLDVSGQLSADALYARSGDIADLTVNRLSTSRRIIRYLARDMSDDNYVSIHDEQIEFISGVTDGSTVQAQTPDGLPIYWEADISDAEIASNGFPYIDGQRIFTTTAVTPWPVTVYAYKELVKASQHFDMVGEYYLPVFTFGAGDGTGGNIAWLTKEAEALKLLYRTSTGKDLGLIMSNNGYMDAYGLRRTTFMDFSEWSFGKFSESLEGVDREIEYGVQFDDLGRPVKITEGEHVCDIRWGDNL